MSAFVGWMVPEACRVTGVYYYFFPTYAQGKKIIWDGIDSSGVPLLHYIAHYLGMEPRDAARVIKFNETELQITLPTIRGGSQGSIIQLVGTDNLDSIMGTNPIGCIYSEYALQNPQAWSFTRPILEANGGWAVFVFTPRGDNHAFKLYEEACKSDKWFVSLKTVQDTVKHDGSPIISMDQINNMRREGESEDVIQQEYFCSFSGAQTGSFYSNLVNDCRNGGRVRPDIYDSTLPVDTFWDIGNGDSTVVGFRQVLHNELRWIDCYSAEREGLDHYASVLAEKARIHKYRYRHHYFPHDMKVREFSTNESRIAAARRMGISPCSVVAKRPLYEGIDAVRRRFQRYWFDSQKCARLLNALSYYHKKWDKHGNVFSDMPDHDWTSHFADMVRYEAIVGDKFHRAELELPKFGKSDFDPWSYNEDMERFDPLSE